jgi:hypothetical protein
MEIKSILGEKVLIEWRKMQSLQPDNLKLPYNIAYLKQSLIENNFAMPFFGWQNGEDVFVVDGHQRLQVLMELESEGVKIPELLDCQLINAKDRKEAVKILLKVYNQRSNPIDLEVLTEWVNIEQVEVEVQSLNVVEIKDVLDSDDFGTDFALPEGDKAPFQQMTFTLADEQATQIKNAIADIKQTDEYKYAETMGNENSNGNALYLIIMQWAEQRKF